MQYYGMVLQPRSQALSPLPPLFVGRKTWLRLVTLAHVTICVANFSMGVETTNNFVDLN